jgi:hypothetical protein
MKLLQNFMSKDSTKTGLPPIFQDFTRNIGEADIISSSPANTFLENIAIDDAGDLYITSLEEGVVYHINIEGEKEIFAKINGQLVGIYYLGERRFLLNGWDRQGIPTIYLLYDWQKVVPLHQPSGAQFLNGMTAINDHIFLICDSYKGCIWRYNMEENKSDIWLQDALLSRADEANSKPAANGIKIFKDTVYVSNTDKQLLITIELIQGNPGLPKIFMDKLNLDDFAFDPEGNIFAATHIYNSVVKITPQKTVTIIGEEQQGLAGSTAVAFGKRGSDKNCIYVTTNGGMSFPLPEGIQEGRVVKIKVR